MPLDTLVSMNSFVFSPKIKDIIVSNFSKFLDKNIDKESSEYLIPDIINEEVQRGNIKVKVSATDSVWHGVTYKEDKDAIVSAIREYIEKGVYPEKLF